MAQANTLDSGFLTPGDTRSACQPGDRRRSPSSTVPSLTTNDSKAFSQNGFSRYRDARRCCGSTRSTAPSNGSTTRIRPPPTTCAGSRFPTRATTPNCPAPSPMPWSAPSTSIVPLWECWIIEGLKGNQWAILMKVHHCLADGISAAQLLTRLCDEADGDTFANHVGANQVCASQVAQAELGRCPMASFGTGRHGHQQPGRGDMARGVVGRAGHHHAALPHGARSPGGRRRACAASSG